VLNNMAQSPLLEGLSDWLFNIIPTSTEELRQVAEIGVTDLGLKTFATLVVDSDLGKGDVDVLTGYIDDLGGEVVANESFPVGASDMRTALTRIRDINPDGLYLVGNTDELGNAIAQAGELGIKAQLLGRTQTLDPAVLSRAGAAADGMVGSATVFRPSEDNTVAQEFIDAYKEHTGQEPSVFAAVAYDAVSLLGAAYTELGSDANSEDVATWLNSQTDFPGVMGSIKIVDGTAAYPLFQFEIENGAAEPFTG
jgi:branched-chain amino acid transport system substrate-binding protein